MGFLSKLGYKIRVKTKFYIPVKIENISGYAQRKTGYYSKKVYPNDGIRYFKGRKYAYKVKYTSFPAKGSIHWKIYRKKRVHKSPYDSLISLSCIIVGLLFLINSVPSLNFDGTLNSSASYLTDTFDSKNDECYLTGPASHNYYYKYGSLKGNIKFTTYEGFNSELKKETHSYYSDYVREIYGELENNDYQDEYLQPLINEIKSISGSSQEQAKIVISLVQHLKYDYDAYYSQTVDWQYPYETLHREKGVCGAKSVLLAYLLGKLDFDVVIFEFGNENHDAVGIKTDSGSDFWNTGYALIETTHPTIITYEPPEYTGFTGGLTHPTIKDATAFAQLDGRSRLSRAEYNQWLALVEKYDIILE